MRLGRQADQDYLEAFAWYEERSLDAAKGFQLVIAAALSRIGENPFLYPQCNPKGDRYVVLPQYPFSLVYRVRGDEVEVLAVPHSSRQPRDE